MNESAALSHDTEGLINISGVLTYTTAKNVLVEARGFLEKVQSAQVTIDLAAVTHSDSAGLALLIEWTRFTQKKGKTVVFKHLPAQMLALASASGLDDVLPINLS